MLSLKDQASIFITICGSVDDGKSTLMGKLLFESKVLYTDQITRLKNDTKKYSNLDTELDYSLIMDGLLSEREQGITIDIAFNYFEHNNIKYIICDTPGHQKYTKNMASATSISEAAILLINIKKGITEQTKRHLYLLSFYGIKTVAVVINKIDLVSYSEKSFNKISLALHKLLNKLEFNNVKIIPCSPINNVNVIKKSTKTKWYKGPSLIEFFKKIKPNNSINKNFILLIQQVVRNKKNKRFYLSKVVQGNIKEKDEFTIHASQEKNKIKNIFFGKKRITDSSLHKLISFTTSEESDISRGNIISKNSIDVLTSNKIRARIFWFANEPLYKGRVYLFYRSGLEVSATISNIINYFDFKKFKEKEIKKVEQNYLAEVDIELKEKISFTPFGVNQFFGSFILIDALSKETVGSGIIKSAIKVNNELFFQNLTIGHTKRALIKNQRPFVLWFTGLSGAGKTTIANILDKKLFQLKKHTYILDGDNIRSGINNDLGFSEEDRIENIRRVSETAKLFFDAGIITIVALISPFRHEREEAKNKIEKNRFFEIFINTPLKLVNLRDPKNLYKKARIGENKNMIGVKISYEPPTNPFIEIKTEETSAEEAANLIIKKLKKINLI